MRVIRVLPADILVLFVFGILEESRAFIVIFSHVQKYFTDVTAGHMVTVISSITIFTFEDWIKFLTKRILSVFGGSFMAQGTYL
jgi:hypothetical protein